MLGCVQCSLCVRVCVQCSLCVRVCVQCTLCVRVCVQCTLYFTRKFSFSPNSSGLSCLDNHPAQPYLFATGGIEGSVMFWDIRNTKRSSPVKVVTAHSGAGECVDGCCVHNMFL